MDAGVGEDRPHELVVPVQAQRELDVLAGHPVESFEEVGVVRPWGAAPRVYAPRARRTPSAPRSLSFSKRIMKRRQSRAGGGPAREPRASRSP